MAGSRGVGRRTRGALQLLLFASPEETAPEAADERREGRSSNIVALFDLAPRWVFDHAGPERFRDMIDREFAYGGKLWRLELTPARIKRGRENADVFPGEREQLVEEVLRRIATKPGRLSLREGTEVVLYFSVHEVRQELASVGHAFRYDEICEALEIIHKASLKLTCEDERGASLSQQLFPVLARRTRRNPTGETYIQFNGPVADAIRTLQFRPFAYDRLMRLRSPLARWLFKRIEIGVYERVRAGGPAGPVVLRASEVATHSGMPRKTRHRNMLRRIEEAFEGLGAVGILDDVAPTPEMEGLRKKDVVFAAMPSRALVEEVRRSCAAAAGNLADFREMTGIGTPAAFVPAGPERALELRRRRARRLAAEGPFAR